MKTVFDFETEVQLRVTLVWGVCIGLVINMKVFKWHMEEGLCTVFQVFFSGGMVVAVGFLIELVKASFAKSRAATL